MLNKNEMAYAEFCNLFSYSYYAQEDGGTKSVIFTYYPKGLFERDEVNGEQIIKFEADSLEKAFNFAFSRSGVAKYPREQWNDLFGKIRKFDAEAFGEQVLPDMFFSIGDKKWKSLAACLKAEEEIKLVRKIYLEEQ
jgi:hypothetical protein